MLSLLRLTAALLLVGTLTAAYLAVQPEHLSNLGLDVWEMPGLLNRLHQEDVRKEELSRKENRLQRSVARKDAAVQALSEGHLTLAEAVEEFRQAASDSLPLILSQLRLLHPDAPNGELLHLHVLDWAQAALEHQPAHCFRVVGRLQVELRAIRPTLTSASAR